LDGKQAYPSSNAGDGAKTIWPDVTIVFQQFFLWPHLTLRRNILLPASLRGRPVERADNLCDELGILHLLDRYPNQVSVGERQRAALARAILIRPRFLLLDEITSAQDVHHVALLLKVLQVVVENGTGLLVVSHHVGFARRLLSLSQSSRVVFLETGAVIETGGVDCLEAPRSDGFRKYVEFSRNLA